MRDFNCMTMGDSLRAFVSFEIAPVCDRMGPFAAETDYGVTSPGRADIWTLYGRTPQGDARALHDAATAAEAAGALREVVAEAPRPVGYLDDARCVEADDIADLAAALAERMLAAPPLSPPPEDRAALLELIDALRV